MSVLTPLDPNLVHRLRSRLDGEVVTPDDPRYDDMRAVVFGDIDRHPVAIARVANTGDVSAVVSFAAEHGTEVAVRSGGHSAAGYGVTEGGVVIDLRDMRALDIDPEARTAWAETGLTAGDYTAAAAEHGLATGFGDMGTVGIGGITLGGGVGYLVRKYGMTIDDLLAAEIVTADGQVRMVDADNHPDLFWAIRGGGGNFGVATRLKFRLHEVREVVGGMLILPATPEATAGAVAVATDAPDELSTIITVMKAPPMPLIPPEVHGRLITMVLTIHAGAVDAGEEVVNRFREVAPPLVDQLGPMNYADMFLEGGPPFRPMVALRTMFMDGFDESDARSAIERIEASTAAMAAVQVRALGGAMARVPADATAFAHRDRKLMVNVTAMYMDPAAAAAQWEWVDGLTAELVPDGDGAAYVGFLGDEGADRVRGAYPGATWERLAAVKRRYDPTNLFRLNQNVPPAGVDGAGA